MNRHEALTKAEQKYDRILRLALDRIYFPDRSVDETDLTQLMDWLEAAVERELSQSRVAKADSHGQFALTRYRDEAGREYIAELTNKLRAGQDLEEKERLLLFSWITSLAEGEISKAQSSAQ